MIKGALRLWNPLLVVFLIVMTALPFFGEAKLYSVYPEKWVSLVGSTLLVLFLLLSMVTSYVELRAKKVRQWQRPLAVTSTVLIAIAIPLSFLDHAIHRQFEFWRLRPSMERHLAQGGPCPTLQCVSDNGVAAFVYGRNRRAWTGLCHDPEGKLKADRDAARAERRADQPPQPRTFDAVVFRANDLDGGWVACGATKRPLQEAATQR